ncbi:helix-turn-helix transcriptional regulator [Actinomadura rubrisoli]|nr:helix-turn-helix transcriptional regulator [Actinomadura rubrisoli]
MLLRDHRGSWGGLGLLRARGARPFDAADIARAARLGPALTAILRRCATRAPLVSAVSVPPTGVVLVGPDERIRAATPSALAWAEHMRAHVRAPEWITLASVTGLAMRARRLPSSSDAGPLVIGPAAVYGGWISVEAQPLDDDIAIVIQSAPHSQALAAFCDWYGLTPRERTMVTHLCDAFSAKQIARLAGLSLHTVNDHLKTIYRKTGATGRDELTAALNR